MAARLGYTFLDTGALYRTVAHAARERQIPWTDGPRLGDLARALTIAFAKDREKIRVHADGRDVTEAIRTPEISEGASLVSALPEVRAGLLDLQRRVAMTANVVAEGRDVGTVVFPLAKAKFFLVANPETRALRRTLELQAKGQAAVLAEVLADMRVRDERDSGRTVAPLRRAEDAIEIDTSDLVPEQVIEKMAEIVCTRGG